MLIAVIFTAVGVELCRDIFYNNGESSRSIVTVVLPSFVAPFFTDAALCDLLSVKCSDQASGSVFLVTAGFALPPTLPQ